MTEETENPVDDSRDDEPGLTNLQLETLSGDLRDAMLMQFRDVNCAWTAMSEDKQRDVANAMQLAAGELVRSAVRLLSKHEFPRCIVQLGEIKIVGGDKSRIEGKVIATNISENREVLGDHVNTMVELVCVDSSEFMGERAPAEIDPDQPELPTGDEADDPETGTIPKSMTDKAKAVILREGKASTSFVQRRLAIGYNKAARIIEDLEADGFLSPPDETGKRDILGDPDKGSEAA